MSLIDEARELRKNWQALLPANDNTNVINAEELCDEWVAGSMEAAVHYEANMCYRYKSQVYRCVQSHDNHGEKGFELDVAASLFHIAHTKNKGNPKPFIQPTGAHDV